MASALDVAHAALPLFPGYALNDIRVDVLDPTERDPETNRLHLRKYAHARVWASRAHSRNWPPKAKDDPPGSISVEVLIADLPGVDAVPLAQARALGALLECVQRRLSP